MYQFSQTSEERLNTCHRDIQLIMRTAIKISKVDFGIAEGHRSVEKQQQYYREGKSQIDGINEKGKHNYEPSLAVDVYAWVNGKANWDEKNLSYLGGIFEAVAWQLKQEKKIEHEIRWGGNWDMDGVIMDDQSFDDLPHIEII